MQFSYIKTYIVLEVIRPLKTEALLSITNNNNSFDKLMCNLFFVIKYNSV